MAIHVLLDKRVKLPVAPTAGEEANELDQSFNVREEYDRKEGHSENDHQED